MDFYHSSRYQVNVLSCLNALLLAVHYNIEFLGVTLYSAVWCAKHPFFYSLIYQGELSLSNTLLSSVKPDSVVYNAVGAWMTQVSNLSSVMF